MWSVTVYQFTIKTAVHLQVNRFYYMWQKCHSFKLEHTQHYRCIAAYGRLLKVKIQILTKLDNLLGKY